MGVFLLCLWGSVFSSSSSSSFLCVHGSVVDALRAGECSCCVFMGVLLLPCVHERVLLLCVHVSVVAVCPQECCCCVFMGVLLLCVHGSVVALC